MIRLIFYLGSGEFTANLSLERLSPAGSIGSGVSRTFCVGVVSGIGGSGATSSVGVVTISGSATYSVGVGIVSGIGGSSATSWVGIVVVGFPPLVTRTRSFVGCALLLTTGVQFPLLLSVKG